MKFRRRKPDPTVLAEETEEARAAAAEARAAREKVHEATSEIMEEVRAHTGLLRQNNFEARLRAALGGAER